MLTLVSLAYEIFIRTLLQLIVKNLQQRQNMVDIFGAGQEQNYLSICHVSMVEMTAVMALMRLGSVTIMEYGKVFYMINA